MATVYNIPSPVPYWNLLKGLSNDVKIALIAKLSDSILTSKVHKESHVTTLRDFYGCMKGVDYPSIDEIKTAMVDKDKDINSLLI
jgi:hypothetical protein